MGFFKTGVSAIGKLLIVAGLAAAFLLGMFGVVVLSLKGDEVKVPDIAGRDFFEAEKELAQLGLKIKRRATRYSEEKPNTVLEQSPRAGEPVKTGNTILVVISQANPEGKEDPATIKKEEESTDEGTADDIDLDKPKKTNKNSNVKKPQTTRDVVANKDNKNTNTSTSGSNTGTPKPGSNTSTPPGGANKGGTPPSTKPSPGNSPKGQTGGDTRTRKVP